MRQQGEKGDRSEANGTVNSKAGGTIKGCKDWAARCLQIRHSAGLLPPLFPSVAPFRNASHWPKPYCAPPAPSPRAVALRAHAQV